MIAPLRPASSPRVSLEALLTSLFDREGLLRHLTLGPEGDSIAAEMPSGTGLRDLVHSAVNILLRRGLVEVAFFDRLVAEVPKRSAEIRAVCGAWITARPPGEACPSIRRESPAVAHLVDQLEQAYQAREDRIVRAEDCSEIDQEILRLRREIRRGRQLHRGESLLGRYRLIDTLGSGGFAVVWRAYDRETRGLVALKVLHGQWRAEPSYRERFIRGARTMAHLAHTNIVRIVREPCDDDGFLFYVMDLVDGVSLHRAVLTRQISLRDASYALLKICDALAYAHSRGYVHRDVKPANILLDHRGHIYLSDFDLIRGDDTTGGTRTGAGIGSLYYAAPEALADASRADARADVYSMGMTLLFAALGRDIRLDDLYDVQMDAISAEPAITPLIYRATARHVERRHGSIDEFKAALVAVLDAWPDPAAASEAALARILGEWVYCYGRGIDFDQSVPLGPHDRTLVVTTRSLAEVASDAIVHFQLCSQQAAVTRPAADPKVNIAMTKTAGTWTGTIITCFITGDLMNVGLDEYRRLVHDIVGQCAQAAVTAKATSLKIPAPFHVSERVSGSECVRELIIAVITVLRDTVAPDQIQVCLVQEAVEMIGEGRLNTRELMRVNTVITTAAQPQREGRSRPKEVAGLVVIHGGELGRKYVLDSSELTIGRGTHNDIVIGNDAAVSRTHAILGVEDARVRLRDNESTNGITVNGVMVQEAWLKLGDILKVGRVAFRFLRGDDFESLYQKEILRLSTVDGLTQAFNKRFFLESLEREVSRARRLGQPLALLVLDIDDFVQCNARYGYRAGDEALSQIAALLFEHCRKVDLIARTGGDEFAVILPECELQVAERFATTLHALVSGTKFVFESRSIPITVSIGVAVLTEADATFDHLLARVAERLQAARSRGDAQVVAQGPQAD